MKLALFYARRCHTGPLGLGSDSKSESSFETGWILVAFGLPQEAPIPAKAEEGEEAFHRTALLRAHCGESTLWAPGLLHIFPPCTLWVALSAPFPVCFLSGAED